MSFYPWISFKARVKNSRWSDKKSGGLSFNHLWFMQEPLELGGCLACFLLYLLWIQSRLSFQSSPPLSPLITACRPKAYWCTGWESSTFQLALSIGDYYWIEISRTDEGSRGTYRSLFSFVSLLIKYLSRRRWKKQGPRWNFYLWKRSFTRKMSVHFLVQNWVVRKVSIETLRSFFSPF